MALQDSQKDLYSKNRFRLRSSMSPIFCGCFAQHTQTQDSFAVLPDVYTKMN